MLVNKENKQKYIQSYARHFNKTIQQVEKEVEENPEKLEGWAEHLANDFEELPNYHKSYRNKYYE